MRLLVAAVTATALLAGCTQFLTGELGDPVPAPRFSAVDTDGQTWNLTDLRGKIVLVDFMGTWCGPCQRAVPVMKDLQAAYPDLQVISFTSTDTAPKVQDFRARTGADWPHIVDDGSIVRAYREAGSNAPNQMWPSYAIVDGDGVLRFYNRGETLPATFAAALEDLGDRQAPAIGGDAWPGITLAFMLGALAWSSPFLLPYTWHREKARPPLTSVLPLAMYGLLGVLAAWYSRPLSGRVATVAPFLTAAGIVAIGYWRLRATSTAPEGKLVTSDGDWRHATGFWGNTLWYLLPVWGAVLHAAMLRTATVESLAFMLAFALGLVVAEQGRRMPALEARMQAAGDHAGWIGAIALLGGALWNGLLYLR